jgi:hypothetical protein
MADRCEICGRSYSKGVSGALVSEFYDGAVSKRPCYRPDCPHTSEQAEPDAPIRYLNREESAAMDRALRNSVTVISEGTPADVEAAAPTADDPLREAVGRWLDLKAEIEDQGGDWQGYGAQLAQAEEAIEEAYAAAYLRR